MLTTLPQLAGRVSGHSRCCWAVLPHLVTLRASLATARRFGRGASEGEALRDTDVAQGANGSTNRKKFRAIFVPKRVFEELDEQELGRRRNRRRPALVKQSDWAHVCAETPVFRRRLAFLGAAKTPSSFVPAHPGVKEVAFIGRSNAGKSSLLNAISKSAPAIAGDKPGVTKTVNFYAIPKTSVNVVDLPGYGFAFGKQEDIDQYTETAKGFLETRSSLKRVFLLIDSRIPLKKIDLDFMQYLNDNCAARFQLVMTKSDLVALDDLARRYILAQEEVKKYPRAVQKVAVVSAASGAGVRNLRQAIIEATGLKPGLKSPPPASTAGDRVAAPREAQT